MNDTVIVQVDAEGCAEIRCVQFPKTVRVTNLAGEELWFDDRPSVNALLKLLEREKRKVEALEAEHGRT